jgi:uracil-DNA glycosylase family 4
MNVELCRACPYQSNNKCGIGPEQVGDGQPSLIFVGESPAKDEREALRPFVGSFGGLLRQMIRAYNTDKETYILANLTACVPDERYKSNQAVGVCRERTLDLLRSYPDARIVALGSVPAQVLAGIKSITRHDGTWINHNGRDVLCLSIGFINNILSFPGFDIGFRKAFQPVQYPMTPDVKYFLHHPNDRSDTRYSSYDEEMDRWWFLNVYDEDIAIDIETTGFDFTKETLLSVGIGIHDVVHIYDLRDWGHDQLKDILHELFDNPEVRIGFHNGGNFDLPWLMYLFDLPYRLDWDTLLMHYSFCEQGLGGYNADFRDAASKGHGLKLLARHYLNVGGYDDGITFDPQTATDWDNLHKYLAIDVWNTLQLKRVFDQKIAEEV